MCSEKDRPPAESTPAATVGTDAAHGRVSTAGAVNGVCPARARWKPRPLRRCFTRGKVSVRLSRHAQSPQVARCWRVAAVPARAGYDRPPRVPSGAFQVFPPCPHVSQDRLRHGDDAAAILLGHRHPRATRLQRQNSRATCTFSQSPVASELPMCTFDEHASQQKWPLFLKFISNILE